MTRWSVLTGDVREKLGELEPGSVQCCVTSPPFWGLRDYGHANQIGLETTPDAFVAEMVRVFSEVKRTLADDGVCWLNLGDSYSGNANSGGENQNNGGPAVRVIGLAPKRGSGLKSKDLVGIPWRVAFALQADGWYLRSDIIWAKPNPMPESVTDRPTKSHEYIFLLSKSARYFYNGDAIKNPPSESLIQQVNAPYVPKSDKDFAGTGAQHASNAKARILEGKRKVSDPPGQSPHGYMRDDGVRRMAPEGLGSNARTVWTIPTQPYPGAHFATFPEEIPTRCILAGSREGDTVLDPFCGSGTSGAVAVKLQRHFIGIELNPAYVQLARKRIGDAVPLFAQEQAVNS